MTQEEARRILGIAPDCDLDSIKKHYRRLMHRLHPDSHASDTTWIRHVQQINEAYSLLKRKPDRSSSDHWQAGTASGPVPSQAPVWDAPVNPFACRERDIYCYAEAPDGSIIGTFRAARGRYFWQTEEDFPLFLRSIHQCARAMLDETGTCYKTSPEHLRIHASLAYLLAQQFIDSTVLLKELSAGTAKDEEGAEIYSFSGMLEASSGSHLISPGTLLYPSCVRNHRLYLKDRSHRISGYLSFPDDRLYYVLVPLFEQRRVLVKIRCIQAGPKSPRLQLLLKIRQDPTAMQFPENLNLQIEKLLEKYRSM